MIDVEQIKQRLEGSSLANQIDKLPKGYLRIETRFLYPDGSSVDLFLVEDSGPPMGQSSLPPTKLSDLGQTMSWLIDVQVKPWLSKKRQRLVEDALRLYDVQQEGGALVRELKSLSDLAENIVLLGQACVRVADLSYTKRSALQSTFFEQVEEIIADADVNYEPRGELAGRFNNLVTVDFLTRGRRQQSAVLTLASGSSSQAHTQANEIFRKWHDLDIPERTEQKVTVFDDNFDVYREDDLERIRQYSDLIALSDPQTLVDLLAA